MERSMSDLSLERPEDGSMTATLRVGTPQDAEAAGRICHQAFTVVATAHGYPSDFPAPEISIGLMTMLLSHPGFYSVVAEHAGTIVGSNFLDERSKIAGVGPVTAQPAVQNGGIGRRLMRDVMERASARGFAGVRLLTAAHHSRSVSLYASLGFEVREPIACMQGAPIAAEIPGRHVRSAVDADLDACNQICEQVHGHDRGGELADSIGQGTAAVVERAGRISGYATAMAFFGHAVGETTDDIKALIATAPAFDGLGILVPARNGELFRWCLDSGLRVVQVMMLMTVGPYSQPAGAYLPAILY
jgi:GNAT superfamily N-acetyltransferase